MLSSTLFLVHTQALCELKNGHLRPVTALALSSIRPISGVVVAADAEGRQGDTNADSKASRIHLRKEVLQMSWI